MDGHDGSPARGLKSVLSIKRGSKDDSASFTNEQKTPLRESADATFGKFKSFISSADDGELSDGKRPSKLLPGLAKLKDRKRRKSQAKAESVEDLRERNGTPKTPNSLGLSPSCSTLDDEQNSLVTSDSEEEPHMGMPPFRTRESHAGYLTSTSPEIKAIAVPSNPVLPRPRDPSPTSVSTLSKSMTLPVTRKGSISPVRPGTSGDASSKRGLNVAQESAHIASPDRSRSISPASKPKSQAIQKVGGSLASRRLSRGSETSIPPAIQISNSDMIKNDQSVPSIVTVPDTPPFDGLREPPKTTITPPTPVDAQDYAAVGKSGARTSVPSPLLRNPNITTSASGNMISHRRIRSDSNTPSKLSYSMTAPLTPLEEARTPATSRNASGATMASGGFFSSMFSAAQNAASTLSSTLGNNTTRPKSAVSPKGSQDDATTHEAENAKLDSNAAEKDDEESAKPRAIDTIGSGELSLSHLGISTDSQTTTGSMSPTPGTTDSDVGRSRSGTVIRREETPTHEEGLSAARAVSMAYGETPENQIASTPVAEDVGGLVAPKSSSLNNSSLVEEKTPLTGSLIEGDSGGVFRSSSIRSRVGQRKKRHRNSSGATAIGAAIAASHSALNVPATTGSSSKVSGFAVANKKRNKDFHNFFRSVPEDDYLIEDYSCALQREIILAGRIYISEGHICFSSNILGWVTNLVISFDEVVSVEKESTAMLFANAIAIQTLHARHTFRSLLSRDATYDLIINIWQISHPGLQSSENGIRLASGTGSKTEKVDSDGSDGSDGSLLSGEVYDEDDEDSDFEGTRSVPGTREGSLAGSEGVDVAPKGPVTRKPSALGIAIGQATAPPTGESKAAEKAAVAAAAGMGDFPGPVTHAPTECTDSTTHYDRLLKDELIAAPLGKVYSMVFGLGSGVFMSRWLTDDIKVTDLQMEDDRKGLAEDKRTRTFTYVKPLNAPIGPRTTKCIITEQLDVFDLEKSITVTVTTQTPDVPSGNLFITKTRYCFMWGPNNGTRLVMCFTLEWTGKSWIKAAIEKGANDGQMTYANDLVKALRAGVSSRVRTMTSNSKGKKVRKRKSEGDALKGQIGGTATDANYTTWGLFEPIHKLLRPVSNFCKPLLNLHSLVGLLVFLLIISWLGNFRFRNSSQSAAYAGNEVHSTARAAIWEDIWRNEEETFWAWLEDRVGLQDGLAFPVASGGPKVDRSKEAKPIRDRAINDDESQGTKTKSMSSREIEWAIQVTEEKLRILKQKVGGGPRGIHITSSPGKSSSAHTHDERSDLTDEQAAKVGQVLSQDLGS